MFRKNKMSWKDLYLEKEYQRDKMMKNIIDVRMALYVKFPERIKEISDLFQLYDLE